MRTFQSEGPDWLGKGYEGWPTPSNSAQVDTIWQALVVAVAAAKVGDFEPARRLVGWEEHAIGDAVVGLGRCSLASCRSAK